MGWRKNRFEGIISYIYLAALEDVWLDSAVEKLKWYKINMLCIKSVIPCLNGRLQNTIVLWELLPPIRSDLGGIQQELIVCSRLYGATSAD